VVIIQQPADLDAACRMALLREEVFDGQRRDKPRRFEAASFCTNARPTTPLPLPAPPTRGSGLAGAEDRRVTDASRGRPEQDKVAALRSYRKAKGLCFTRGERWGRDHKCPAQIQLHVVEELLQMLEGNDSESVCSQGPEEPRPEQLAALSCHAVQGTSSTMALRLLGLLEGKPVKLLIDSGSSSSFLNSKLVSDRMQVHDLPRRFRVHFADDGELLCT
jgi:hypothetical protein